MITKCARAFLCLDAAFVKLKEEVSNEENKPIIEAVKQALRSAVHYPFDLLESIFIVSQIHVVYQLHVIYNLIVLCYLSLDCEQTA